MRAMGRAALRWFATAAGLLAGLWTYVVSRILPMAAAQLPVVSQ